MTTKKKTPAKIEEDVEIEEDEEDIEIEEDDDEIINEDNEVIDSSLEIGGQIHTQSAVVKRFKHLPKDVKYSKFNNIDVANYFLKSRTYQLWDYTRKIQAISKKELTIIKDVKKKIYDIKTKEDLKAYLDEIGKMYIWFALMQLDEKEFENKFKAMIKQLAIVIESGMVDSLYRDKDNFQAAYTDYSNNFEKTKDYVDDFGLMANMMTITEINKARGGWAMKTMNTTIAKTINEDISQQAEEEPEVSEGGFKGFLKK